MSRNEKRKKIKSINTLISAFPNISYALIHQSLKINLIPDGKMSNPNYVQYILIKLPEDMCALS